MRHATHMQRLVAYMNQSCHTYKRPIQFLQGLMCTHTSSHSLSPALSLSISDTLSFAFSDFSHTHILPAHTYTSPTLLVFSLFLSFHVFFFLAPSHIHKHSLTMTYTYTQTHTRNAVHAKIHPLKILKITIISFAPTNNGKRSRSN